MNHLLTPLVEELLILNQEGFDINGFEVKGRLLQVCCDIPASRKIGGFYSFTARRGCNKCLKAFPRINSSQVRLGGREIESVRAFVFF